MKFKFVRFDGKDDDLTSQTFKNYEDAYDLLVKIYGDSCCSDTDYENKNYYNIVETQLKD